VGGSRYPLTPGWILHWRGVDTWLAAETLDGKVLVKAVRPEPHVVKFIDEELRASYLNLHQTAITEIKMEGPNMVAKQMEAKF
jgi:hypothetical protein